MAVVKQWFYYEMGVYERMCFKFCARKKDVLPAGKMCHFNEAKCTVEVFKHTTMASTISVWSFEPQNFRGSFVYTRIQQLNSLSIKAVKVLVNCKIWPLILQPSELPCDSALIHKDDYFINEKLDSWN